MKAKNCLIFGGSGQIGRNLIRKLTKNNYQVTVVTRNIHQNNKNDHLTLLSADVLIDSNDLNAKMLFLSALAQLVEQMTVNHWVAGSSPAGGAKYEKAVLCAAFFITFYKSIHHKLPHDIFKTFS